jgi:predicted RNA-binding Zn-ribbon protein involved in translation (DUF1610 family)
MEIHNCSSCNAELNSTDKICPICGKDLSVIGRKTAVTALGSIGVGFSVDAIL